MKLRTIPRFIGILGIIAAAGTLGAACSSGLTTQESNPACKDELSARGVPDDEEAFKSCVVCFEQCSDCKILMTDGKLTFACPADE